MSGKENTWILNLCFLISFQMRSDSDLKEGQITLTILLPVDMGNGPHQVLAATFTLFWPRGGGRLVRPPYSDVQEAGKSHWNSTGQFHLPIYESNVSNFKGQQLIAQSHILHFLSTHSHRAVNTEGAGGGLLPISVNPIPTGTLLPLHPPRP